jgi:hypothetical protein
MRERRLLRNVLVVLAAFNVLYGLGYIDQVSRVSSQFTATESSYAFYSGFMMIGLAFTQLVLGWFVARSPDAKEISAVKTASA